MPVWDDDEWDTRALALSQQGSTMFSSNTRDAISRTEKRVKYRDQVLTDSR